MVNLSLRSWTSVIKQWIFCNEFVKKSINFNFNFDKKGKEE